MKNNNKFKSLDLRIFRGTRKSLEVDQGGLEERQPDKNENPAQSTYRSKQTSFVI